MSAPAGMSVTLSEDGATFSETGAQWSETFPIDRLGGRIAFYSALRDRRDGKFAKFYGPTVDRLKQLRRDIAAGRAGADAR